MTSVYATQFFPDWPGTMNLMISAFPVAGIRGVSQWHPAVIEFFLDKSIFLNYWYATGFKQFKLIF
jgi:hypothetical protein